MAQFVTDFSEYTIDTQLANTADWTIREHTGDLTAAKYTVVSGATPAPVDGDRFARVQNVDQSRDYYIIWDVPGESTDWDLIALMRSAGNTQGIAVRDKGTAGDDWDVNGNFYRVQERNASTTRLRRFLNGSSLTIQQDDGIGVGSDWFFIRLKAFGSDIRCKVWFPNDPEPNVGGDTEHADSWFLSGTNNDVTGDGTAGWFFGRFDTRDLAFMSAGTNGDLAPKPGEVAEPPWSLTVNVEGDGSVVVEDDGTPVDPDTYEWDDESVADLTATPDSGWQADDPLWTGDVPTEDQNDNPLALTMDSDRTVQANFVSEPEPPLGEANRRVRFGGSWWPEP